MRDLSAELKNLAQEETKLFAGADEEKAEIFKKAGLTDAEIDDDKLPRWRRRGWRRVDRWRRRPWTWRTAVGE